MICSDTGEVPLTGSFSVPAVHLLASPDGKIAKIWTGVDPGHHSAEVLAAVAELQSKK